MPQPADPAVWAETWISKPQKSRKAAPREHSRGGAFGYNLIVPIPRDTDEQEKQSRLEQQHREGYARVPANDEFSDLIAVQPIDLGQSISK